MKNNRVLWIPLLLVLTTIGITFVFADLSRHSNRYTLGKGRHVDVYMTSIQAPVTATTPHRRLDPSLFLIEGSLDDLNRKSAPLLTRFSASMLEGPWRISSEVSNLLLEKIQRSNGCEYRAFGFPVTVSSNGEQRQGTGNFQLMGCSGAKSFGWFNLEVVINSKEKRSYSFELVSQVELRSNPSKSF